ncbi:MDR family MFS transporter [Haloferula sp.]|uniref:MDR family MFS transporter n=1 Tax=Haloferula sp. TaxID=2497595 RepID=UPI00329F1638
MNTQNTNPPIRGSLIADLKKLPKPFYLLMAGSFINRFGHFVIPFLAIYLRQLGFAPSVTGLALAAFGLGGLAASFIGGYLADRIGRKPTLLISCFGAAAAMLILSVAQTVPTLLTGTFLSGLMTCMYYPASSSLIADLIPQALRVRAYAVQRFVINLAFGLGMCTAGLVASSSFFWLFIVDAATTVVLGFIILFGLARGIGRKSVANAGWGTAIRSIAHDGCFLRAAIASFLIAVIFWQISSTLGLQVTDHSGFDEKAYGFLLGLNGLMIVFLELPLTNWTRHFNPQRIIAVGYSLVGLSLAMLALGGSMPMLIISMVLLTIGEMIALPINSSYVADLAPESMRGRYMGVMGLSWNAAAGLGPMLGLWVFARSPETLWMLCGFVGLAAAGIILVRNKAENEITEEAPLGNPEPALELEQ